MIAFRRLEKAKQIIASYRGDIPLHIYVRSFYRRHPEMGGRDRKICSSMVYAFYRTGHAFTSLAVEKRIAYGLFLTGESNDDALSVIEEFTELKSNQVSDSAEMRVEHLQKEHPFHIYNLFPFNEELSSGMDHGLYALSMLSQPMTWIRCKSDKTEALIQLLNESGVDFKRDSDSVGFKSGIKLETLIADKSWYEVQDRSSQSTGELFKPQDGESWYDCCAASGGKSLLLKDKCKSLSITVSDNRQSILDNLALRFSLNGIEDYRCDLIDLETTKSPYKEETFDGVIADVPCSGSGTWSRTPEQLCFYKEHLTDHYQSLQKKITSNVAHTIKTGKPLIYITCSVFKKENEGAVNFICKNMGFTCEEMQLINGIGHGADTMFAARLIKK